MRLLNRALTAVLLAAAVVGVLVVAGPLTGRYRTTTVLSGSMRPTIDPGDVVVATPIPSDDVRTGDVVTFQRPNGSGTVTHRVTAVHRADGELEITTKGDANEAVDTYAVTFVGDTAWRTKVVIPKVGYAFVWMRALLEQQLYLPIVGALLLASLLWSIWRPAPKEADALAA